MFIHYNSRIFEQFYNYRLIMEELNTLITRRGTIKASLTRFQNYIKLPDCDRKQIPPRREKIEEAWQSFEYVQTAIEELDGEIKHAQYRVDFEDLYFELISESEQMINPIKHIETPEQNDSFTRNSDREENMSSMPSIVKLAALKIPIFNGNYADWVPFHDMFVALIHTNSSLTPIQKFFYLRSSLSDDASNCIKNLKTTSNNYEHAWKTLISRYNNEKLLIQSHVKDIYDLYSVKENSLNSLRQFMDTLTSHMSALDALKQQPNEWGPLLIHVICTKLDGNTLCEWEKKASKNKLSKVEELITFLGARSQMLEAIDASKDMIKTTDLSSENKNINRKYKFNTASTSLMATIDIKCFVCKLSHTIYKCPSFLALSVTDRIKKVNELNLCKICLRKHESKRCMARKCYKCNNPHNTMLHIVQQKEKEEKSEEKVNNNHTNQQIASTSTNTHASDVQHENVLLSTAVVRAIGKGTKSILCRALLDSGSQRNFITEELVQILQLKKSKTNHKINDIGAMAQHVYSYVIAQFASCVDNYKLSLKLLVVPKITGDLPSKNLTNTFRTPENINLADPLFRFSQKVDMLIGATHFYELMCAQKIKLNKIGPVFQKTKLGWIVSGPVPISGDAGNTEPIISVTQHSTSKCTDSILENILPLFWRMEEFTDESPYTIEEKACNNYFEHTVIRGTDGRFVVHLPFRDNLSKLGNSYDIAKRRFLSLERRFEKDLNLKIEYTKFINEYKELGRMEQVSDEECNINGTTCYLPHHAVLKESSTSTRLRVVFDASCKTDNGVSLNDVLLKGPVLQDDLLYILTRFRTHNFVLSADITKMYRQFWIADIHRSFQRILWRSDPNESIKIFQLKTITYGTVPASFLATACLKKISGFYTNNKPRGSNGDSTRLLYG